MGIEVDIEKKLGDFELKISFKHENDFLALSGPSGAGKSLTLKCIAGIDTPDSGKIILNERVLFDSEKKINLKPQDRMVGLLFQDYALFPNMTVWQNIEIANRNNVDIKDFLEKFKLSGLEKLYPYQLSGGQKQRCAMARMLITNPELVMLDEPFNSLDEKLKGELMDEVKGLIMRLNKPAIIVSHNETEIKFFTDNVISINKSERSIN